MGLKASPVTGASMASRNAMYELRKREQGLTKVTLWIPENCKAEFMQMAQYCINNRECTPFMAKNSISGRFEKAVD